MPDTDALVINTSPMLALIAALGDLRMLQMYSQVYVPFEVCQEILIGGRAETGGYMTQTAMKTVELLQAELQRFETQYHQASAEFYQRFQKGELGDAADYFEWSACYDMFQAVSTRFKMLNGEMP